MRAWLWVIVLAGLALTGGCGCNAEPTAAEQAGWLPATGHLWPGVVIYLAQPDLSVTDQKDPPKDPAPFAVFDKFEDPSGVHVHSPKGGGDEVWPESKFTNRDAARFWWVRKDDPALAGHLNR